MSHSDPLLGIDSEVEEDQSAARADFAERLVRRFLGLCENPRTRRRMLAMVRGSVKEGGGQRFYGLLARTVLHPLAHRAGVHTSALRLEIVASQLIGLAMMRYVLEVEPVASVPVEDLVARLSPCVRAALDSGR